MSRSQAISRAGDLGITSALYLSGANNSDIEFGHQTFLDGKVAYTFCQRIWTTSSSMSDLSNWWGYGFSSANNAGYCMRPAGSGSRKLQFFYGSGSSTATNLSIVGQQYIFVEYDGTTLRFYNGVTLTDSFTVSAARNSDVTVNTYLGCRDPANRQFTGVVGDGAVYSRVLTTAEKTNIIERALYPSTNAELIVKCNENTGTAITDYSGNSRTGTIGAGGGTWRSSPFNA